MDEERPLRLRWHKDTRYYEIYVERDLWDGWVFTRVWGQRGSALGQIRREPCESYALAERKLKAAERLRRRRGYVLV